MIQVTHDGRFYPKAAPPSVKHPAIRYVQAIQKLDRVGRAATLSDAKRHGLAPRAIPSSFNFRSTMHTVLENPNATVQQVMLIWRNHNRNRLLRDDYTYKSWLNDPRTAGVVPGGSCTPGINWRGDLIGGEYQWCQPLGRIGDSMETVTANMRAWGYEVEEYTKEDGTNTFRIKTE